MQRFRKNSQAMKKVVLLVACISLVGVVQAQKSAVTETGESVILYDDGTWKLAEASDEAVEIPVNPKKFVKGENSTFLLKSNKLSVGFWLNAKKWSFKKAENNEDAEYELQLRNGDLYGMIICEKVEIPLETLKTIALENGKSAAPDLHVAHQEYREVNGLKVLLMQMNGTMQGIKFSFYGYYFSGPNGSIQFLTYTSQNLLEDYKATCEELLNGLVELK